MMAEPTPEQLAATILDDAGGDVRAALLALAAMVIAARRGMSAGMIRLGDRA